MPGLCGASRVSDIDSVAVGPQQVPYICAEWATELVHVNGQTYEMCRRCASEFLEREGGANVTNGPRLQEIADYLHQWANEFGDRPQVAAWFRQRAAELATMAQGEPA